MQMNPNEINCCRVLLYRMILFTLCILSIGSHIIMWLHFLLSFALLKFVNIKFVHTYRKNYITRNYF